jgi:hypothetical protein
MVLFYGALQAVTLQKLGLSQLQPLEALIQ